MTSRKRANGEGSVFRRADGKYVAMLFYIDPATGENKRRSLYGKTSAEARLKLKDARARQERGAPVKDASRTVGDWANQWIKTSLAASPRRDSTKCLYRSLLTCHVLGQPMGAVPLDRLKPTDVGALTVALRDRLGSASINKVFLVLRMCLDDAVRDGLLGRNPMRLLKQPQIVKGEARHLSPSEVQALLSALHGTQYEAIVTLIAVTGLRKGEALGLRWTDVNFERRHLRVGHTLSGFGLSEPKTAKSRRTLPLSEYLVTVLETQRKAQLGDRMRAANVWTDSPYVFTAEQGGPLDPRNTLRAVTDAARRVGLEHVNVHTLRHSAATAMLEAGVHIRGAADILGHSDIRITGDLYAHTSVQVAHDAMTGLAAAFGSVATPVATSAL